MKENEFVKMNDILDMCNAFSQSAQGQLPSAWKRVVSRIKSVNETSENDELSDKKFPLGERLASNTRVLDLKNGTLIVESDHSGWIQYLRMYQKFILNGLKMNLPNLKITNLAFRVTGEKVSLSESYDQQLKKSREEMAKKIEEQEKELKKFEDKKEKPSSELPPELLAKFDSIRQSMLTNSDNK